MNPRSIADPAPTSKKPTATARSVRRLVLASDEAFAMPLAVTMRSIVDANRGAPLEFHVLSDGYRDQTRRRIVDSLPEGAATIHWVQIDTKLFEGFMAWERATRMNYARLLIPRLMPADTERVLYLDPDLVVLDDLDALWETDLHGAAVGAVRDHLVDPMLKQNQLPNAVVPRVQRYFNAGVLLIDLPRWRRERISEKALDYLARHPDTFFADQDALNFACEGNWHELPMEWNYQRHRDVLLQEAVPAEHPRIVHFITNVKPWYPEKLNKNARFYDRYRRRTRFARTPWNCLVDGVIVAWTKAKRLTEDHLLGPERWAALRRALGRDVDGARPR